MIAGGLALLNYGEPGPVWHTRALLAHAGGSNWAILTPDWDVYIEELSDTNPDLTGFYYCGPGGAVPAHIDPNHIYGFQPLTPAQLGAFQLQGQVMANAHLGQVPAAPAAPAAVAPAPRAGHLAGAPAAAAGAPAPVAAAGEPVDTWVALEDGGGFKKGDVICRDPTALPVGHVTLGEKGVLPVQGDNILIKKVKFSEAQLYQLEDLRILPIAFDSQGIRRREFPLAVNAMSDAEPQGGGLLLSGPSTALKLLKGMRDQSFTPSTYHEYWVRSAEISKGDRSVYEHECLSRILESMAVVDQLNIPSLQSAELICRRLQVIREEHRISPHAPDYSASDIMMGWQFRKGGHAIEPGLASHVASELKNEALVAKEARKAREEAESRRKNRPKNKAKGGEGGSDP